jgi:two-component system sensor histidine kinase BarA
MDADVVATNEARLRVLHVDDDPLNLRVVQDVLQTLGHDSVHAISGEVALEEIGRRLFDVVLMDIQMPGMSGLEAVSHLRRLIGPQRRTPVIALTADTLARSRQEYLGLGFQELVTKPIHIGQLSECLLRVTADRREAIRRRSA